MRRLQEVTV